MIITCEGDLVRWLVRKPSGPRVSGRGPRQGAEGYPAPQVRNEREGKLVHWLDPASLVLLVVAIAIFGAVAEMLWEFIRSSSRDPLTRHAPDARSARARRWAGVYVRRPDVRPTSADPAPAAERDRHLV
jgi:hypothetical protein